MYLRLKMKVYQQNSRVPFCSLRDSNMTATQRVIVQQHILASNHQANRQWHLMQRQLFLLETTTAMSSTPTSAMLSSLLISLFRNWPPALGNISLGLRCPQFQMSQHSSMLCLSYLQWNSREDKRTNSWWFYLGIHWWDLIEGTLISNVAISLLNGQYSEPILLNDEELDKCNNETMTKLFTESSTSIDCCLL